ncbi:hypothetical protein [Amycolatopsis sp. cg9]|uniref:hypothetical protein n=1 Tax=Amycolatopsis sp. cg9 TaxID=3238801 RepID=UPI003523A5B2
MTAYAAVVMVLLATSGGVALFVTDTARADRAYRLVKLLLAAVTGGTGLVACLIQLHQVGLL